MSTQPEQEDSLITPTQAATELLTLGEELITYEQASPSSTNLQNYVDDCLLVDPKDLCTNSTTISGLNF